MASRLKQLLSRRSGRALPVFEIQLLHAFPAQASPLLPTQSAPAAAAQTCAPRSARNRFRKRVAVGLSCLLLGHGAAPALTLVSNGKSAYRIVLGADASASERYAADELQRYLEKLGGVKLPIITDSERPGPREILLGDNAHLRQLGLKLDSQGLGAEGFILRTDRDRLIILGGKARGTLYGVYTLLEEKLGVRWFTPELEVAARTNRLVLPALKETRVPALEYREVFWRQMLRDADFAARHRLNGHHYDLKERHGGRPAVYFPFVHSFDQLVPPGLYKDHPDYFPLINGERKSGYVQRCLSNPEVVKLARRTVSEWITQHPEVTIVSVSQNDTANYCQCDACKSFDDAEGSPAASLVRFVNAVAEEIETAHPKVRLDTLAYQYTRKPPKTVRPRPNVIIRLCSIECCFAHPLDGCGSDANRRFCEDIKAWEPVAPLLYVWDYTPNFAHYEQPFPNFNSLQPNVRFFVRHNVKGLFEQGNYSAGGGGEMEPLRSYLLAKLVWNPDTDVEKHTREFCQAYFGQGAPKIRAYLALLERQVADPKVHAHIYDNPKAAYLNESFLKEAGMLLDQAEHLAESDVIRERIRITRLPVSYVKLATMPATDPARAELLSRFLQVARKAGISNISEGQALSDWAKAMGGK